MKILLTMNLPYTRAHGGTNRSNRRLAEELARRGHEVRVVVPALASPSPITYAQSIHQLAADGIQCELKDGASVFTLAGVQVQAVADPTCLRRHLSDQLRAFEPDWALVSSEDPSQSLLSAALETRPGRVVYLAHTPQMFPCGPASLYPGPERAELVKRAAGVVAISRFVAGYLKTWLGLDAFVNHPPHYDVGPFQRRAGFVGQQVLMLNACEVKGLSIFLALARALPEVRFAALPGYGTTRADRAALHQLPNVALLENRANMQDIWRQTSLLLMPTLWLEGFGMAVVDAMQRGIPVLASDYGGLVEAKLGTDYRLPIRPIERFEDRLDENLLPVPVVPEQAIAPWREALVALLSDAALYGRQSAAAFEAASRFVSGLSVAPFEDWLRQLEPKVYAPELIPVTSASPGQSTAEGTLSGIASLTPEQQALLMARYRKRAAQKESKATSVGSGKGNS